MAAPSVKRAARAPGKLRAPSAAAAAKRPAKRAARAIDADVGARIRALRLARKLRLQQLARKTSLSIGFISQIERGLSSPSLSALTSLADALDVSLSQLFDAPAPADAPGQVVVRRRARSQLVAWRTGIYKQLLTADAPARFSFYLMTMEPGAGAGDPPYTHEGEEAGLVLQGRLALSVGSRSWALARGDSFHFPSSEPHRFENAARTTVVVAMLNLRGEEPPRRRRR